MIQQNQTRQTATTPNSQWEAHKTFLMSTATLFRPCLYLFTPTSVFHSQFDSWLAVLRSTSQFRDSCHRSAHPTHTQRFLIVKIEWVLILMRDSGLYTQMIGPTCLRPHDDLMRHNVILVLGQDLDKISPIIFMAYPGFSQWKTSQHRYWTPSSTI